MRNLDVLEQGQKTFNEMPLYDGEKAEKGFYTSILKNVSDVLEYHTQKNRKTLVVRFDLRFPKGVEVKDADKAASKFAKTYVRPLQRNGADPKLVWVWEKDSSQNPHFHCMLAVDGRKHYRPNKLLEKAEKNWGSTIGQKGKPGLVDYCNGDGVRYSEKGYYNLHRNQDNYDEEYRKCFKRCSYLAKVHSKEDVPEHVNLSNRSYLPKK